MPAAPLGYCRSPGCGGVVPRGGWCPLHTLPPRERGKETYNPEVRRRYDRRWGRIRLMFLRRNPLCVECYRPATEVDHVLSLEKDGTHRRSNLQALCKSCHSRKTNREDITPEQRARGGQPARQKPFPPELPSSSAVGLPPLPPPPRLGEGVGSPRRPPPPRPTRG